MPANASPASPSRRWPAARPGRADRHRYATLDAALPAGSHPAGQRAARSWVQALGLCLALAVAAPAMAQWQWRDKDGRLNVSDRPPPADVKDKDILKRPSAPSRPAPPPAPASAPAGATAPTAAAASAPPTALQRELQARQQAAARERAQKAKEDEERLAAARASNCRAARSNLASLDSGQRIVRTNERGEREVLEDRQRAEETRRAREIIASDCR